MKNLVLTILAIFTLSTNAQEHRQDRKGHDYMKLIMKDLTPEEMANLKTKKMTLRLDLTEKQQKQVESIMLEQATERQQKRESRKEKKESEKPSKEEFLEMQNQHLDHQIEVKRQMKVILSEEQYAKFEKMKPRRHYKKGRRIRKK